MRAPALLLSVFLCAGAWAQRPIELRAEGDPSSVMLRGFVGSDDLQPALQATWRFTKDGAVNFSYQALTILPADRTADLRQLLIAAIEQYLDQRVHFAKGGVKADLSDERLMADLHGLVTQAAKEFGVSEAFGGFTEPTMEQLERVTHIDWSKATFAMDAGQDQDKYLAIYYHVRMQRQELQRQFRADLLTLAGVPLQQQVEEANAFSKGRAVTVPTVCSTVYDDQNYLCALDLSVADSAGGLVDSPLTDDVMRRIADQARRTLTDTPAESTVVNTNHRIRKRDRWLKAELDAINIRIDELDQRKELWRLRDRLDDIEGRLDDLGLEVGEMREEREQPGDNPLATLSELTGRNVIVRFERNSVAVERDYQVVLNEVFEQLARSASDRVLITGYTDRSGDPEMNLLLSEHRAKAVRNYLLQRGIAAERLLVNYYGDSRSSGRNPEERRVEVEWLR